MKEAIKVEEIKAYVDEHRGDAYEMLKTYICNNIGDDVWTMLTTKLNDHINTSLENRMVMLPFSLSEAVEESKPVEMPEPDENGVQRSFAIVARWDADMEESEFTLEYYINVNDKSEWVDVSFNLPVNPQLDTSKLEFRNVKTRLEGNVELTDFVDTFMSAMTPPDWAYNKILKFYEEWVSQGASAE